MLGKYGSVSFIAIEGFLGWMNTWFGKKEPIWANIVCNIHSCIPSGQFITNCNWTTLFTSGASMQKGTYGKV